MAQKGMVIDLERCYGCRACMEACKVENSTPRGAFWMHVFRYEDGEYPDVEQNFMPRPCQHCSEPACEKVCPTEARFKREKDGIVLTDYDRCIGCRYCEVACPYGVNYLRWRDGGQGQYDYGQVTQPEGGTPGDDPGDGNPPWHDPVHDEPIEPRGTQMSGVQPQGVMSKCTFCVHRQDSDDPEVQGTTACEQTCPADAIKFGDMDDPDSEPRQHLRSKQQSSSTFELLEEHGTEPNVVYIGKEPTGDERTVEGADTFKDPDTAIEEAKQMAAAKDMEADQ